MTWRELIEKLNSFDGDFLDMDAMVWIDGCDLRLEGEYKITGATPEYPYEPVSADNKLSLDIRL